MMELKSPYQYMLCQNDTCKNASNCLRNLCYKQIPHDKKAIIVLNPSSYPAENDACTEFRSAEKIKIAWGIQNLFDNLLLSKAKAIKGEMLRYFGKTKYYRFYREELPILPADQNSIQTIFKKNGVETEPCFSRFTEDFDWRH